MGRLTTVLNAVGLGAFLAAVAVIVVLGAPGLVGAEATYVVESGSMAPTISPGDVVVITDTPAAGIAAGDVITFRSDRPDDVEVITHRVVEVVQGGAEPRFRTKGDANEGPDLRLVPARAVVGEVAFTIPYLGRLVLFASSDLGLVSLLVTPGLLLVGTELYSLYRDLTREDAPG